MYGSCAVQFNGIIVPFTEKLILVLHLNGSGQQFRRATVQWGVCARMAFSEPEGLYKKRNFAVARQQHKKTGSGDEYRRIDE